MLTPNRPRRPTVRPVPILRAVAVPLLLALAGCGSESAPPAVDPRAARDAAVYAQLREAGQMEQAARLGEDLVARFPGTPAASQVQATLDATRAEGERIAQARRLERLWLYHAVPEPDGSGLVRTATLRSSRDDGTPGDVRLVLRRHPSWGQSVYLLSDAGEFRCPDPCTVGVSVDDAAAVTLPGSVAEQVETPAMFVEADTRFIALLRDARTVRLQLRRAGAETVRFEVAGFDPPRWDPAEAPRAD